MALRCLQNVIHSTSSYFINFYTFLHKSRKQQNIFIVVHKMPTQYLDFHNYRNNVMPTKSPN